MRLEVLETPGHTPEGISILVYDLATSRTDPLAVLTGDTLFIGDVGRPCRAGVTRLGEGTRRKMTTSTGFGWCSIDRDRDLVRGAHR